MTLPSLVTASHAVRLDWFAQHAGQVTGYPPPLPDGSFLVSRPKGIYKPADLEYALSIRVHLDSRYADGQVHHRPDGSWYLSYHQENPDPAQRDQEYTNVGLMACIRDAVPVGVLRERAVTQGQPSQYDVLGLAVPVDWRDGYFYLESLDGPAGPRGDTASLVLLTDAERSVEEQQAAAPPPADDYDARRRTMREIIARSGQPGFRRKLLTAYGSRCALTDADAPAVLEAAHLRPYRGPGSNVTSNGLLLRSDLHTLLDLQLVAIHPDTRQLVVSATLSGTQYAALAGQPLREPSEPKHRPDPDVLRTCFAEYEHAEGKRTS